jgi:hypothetical protein
MARSTDAQKAERLNAAHRLLARGQSLGESNVPRLILPMPAEPEPNRLARSGHTNTSAVRANLDDPPLYIRPICSRRRGFEGQEPNGFNAS